MGNAVICHLRDSKAFEACCQEIEKVCPDLRFGRLELDGGETTLRSDFGGMKVHWLYAGEGEVFVPQGYRTKEGDGQPLPPEYRVEPVPHAFLDALVCIQRSLSTLSAASQPPIQAILGRRHGDDFVGDCANDLWKLEHLPRPWSQDPQVESAIGSLFLLYRDCGYSVKTSESYERIMEGDQLIVAGGQDLKVRGAFSCLTVEKMDRRISHIPSVTRLRYLKDSSGGCNFDFDPFRRLPLTWYMNLPGETGDGLNSVNSHVVNIARETSPTHFHPPRALGGGRPQNEIYLVLNPQAYGLNTYGREASLVVYPDLRDLRRCDRHALEPGHFVFIPAGTGHRGLDVFVNVITIPGFKPHNEYYIDQDVFAHGGRATLANETLLHLKNYGQIEELLSSAPAAG